MNLKTLLIFVFAASCETAITIKEKRSRVVQLTDNNFDDEVARGPYFVKVYAEWCSHCKTLAPAWEELALELENEVFLGKIDGPKERGLQARLGTQGYPSLFLFRDGSAWEYTGQRSMQALARFARTGYTEQDAMPFYKAPNSVMGRAIGVVTGAPAMLEDLYSHLHNDLGYSNLSILSGALALPVFLGLILICILDNFIIRPSPLYPHQGHERPHAA
ncbi:hypothetical protein CYMTET_27150 [Cymbomonas tetramitiformis]|uniref:Thioredoxin domain-containing protein n=1 Tax=Cymbomonas tetramitiformis TaxID=36881 RepID=A0AAE0FQC5_9CHLO|nr:hypothetical protein CYMTET_27150 [Cymbomonas tetramitiformis]